MDADVYKEAAKRISDAKAAIVLDSEQPFFASIVLNVKFQPSEGIQTFATDFKSILYNPAFVCSEPKERVPLCILHEIMHIAMMHGYRRGDRDATLWNVAGDIAINNILKYECKYAIPEHWLYNGDLAGKSAEEIYDLLKKNAIALDISGGYGASTPSRWT